mmetsp:Transcript_62508/g.140984  ORF Transcript_62508/g.140984 Transcript_62508/m.140984 type:complete len:97 (-) Transcript_62508:198-488(-)
MGGAECCTERKHADWDDDEGDKPRQCAKWNRVTRQFMNPGREHLHSLQSPMEVWRPTTWNGYDIVDTPKHRLHEAQAHSPKPREEQPLLLSHRDHD